jgi:hypothetical protein
MYVSSERYMHYIPFWIYTLTESYPESLALVSYRDILSDKVKSDISLLGTRNFIIKEELFKDYPEFYQGYPTSKLLRWVMYHEEYEQYDYIYTGDIDILIVKQTPPFIDRQLAACEKYRVPYGNTIWLDVPHEKVGWKMTGEHGYKRKEYLEKMLPIMDKYKILLKNGSLIPTAYNEVTKKIDNQHFLYELMSEAGLLMPKGPDYFYEYHGVHVAHSRVPGRWDRIWDSEPLHRQYFKEFYKLTQNPIYEEMYRNTIPEIRQEIDLMMESGRRNNIV